MLVILVVLLVFGLVLWIGWPWWMALFLLAIIAALTVAGIFTYRILRKKREENFSHEVIAQDKERISKLVGKERDEARILQERWKEVVEMLKHSHLKKQGNPLYVLPWYMVVGESGAGKSTAIANAELSSPFADAKRVQGISGTKNCEWWFFEKAIIIDTAGRYAIPIDEGRDEEEWQKFLGLMVKYRRREPLHGLIVTVAADKLLRFNAEEIEKDGMSIRSRIDELMRALGIKFPVYVLVTKCDLIQGVARFAEQLPEKALLQPMGHINQNVSKDVDDFLAGALSSISERLKNIRLLLLHNKHTKAADPGTLLFPDEFLHLEKGLRLFMKAAFQENPYQETPLLRGLFFSSGRQEGTPFSQFLKGMGLITETEVLAGTNKSIFLHDFFSKVLPTDRRLFAPTTRAIEWHALTRNLGLISWLLFGVALCGLLSFSFVKNLSCIRSITKELARPIVLTGQFPGDLPAMERLGQITAKVEEENDNWWIPRFGLNESLKVEKGLKQKFCKDFHDGFLAPLDGQTQGAIPQLLTSAGDEEAGQYIFHLVRRINLLQARLNGSDFKELKKKPLPAYVSAANQQVSIEDSRKYGSLYLSYVLWRGDERELHKEVALLRMWLENLISARTSGLQWMVTWVDRSSGLPAVTLADFWGNGPVISGEPSIGPAYTRKGKEMIDSFFLELAEALPGQSSLDSQKAAFYKQYCAAALEKWHAFAAGLPKGAEKLKGARQWKQMASRIAGEQGPYFSFISKAATELPVFAANDRPSWLNQLYQFQFARVQGYAGNQNAATGVARRVTGRITSSFDRNVNSQVRSDILGNQMASGKVYKEMIAAITPIQTALGSKNQIYQMAAQVFADDSGSNNSSGFNGAYAAAGRLKASIGSGGLTDDAVSKLITGPVDFLWTVARMETSCYLQAGWEEKVLAEAQGATAAQSTQFLLAPDGPAWKFVKNGGVASPFIGWNLRRGYYAKEALGGTISFDSYFFSFLAKGAKVHLRPVTPEAPPPKQNFTVLVKGLPTDTNPEARIKPHTVRLDLQCSAGPQNLTNYQYAVSKNFTWSPDSCSDVFLHIEVGELTLAKQYTGPNAFPDFLKSFKSGEHTFTVNEFPAEKRSLEQMGISFIKVNFRFTGEGPVINKAAANAPIAVPQIPTARFITHCWAD